MGLVVSAVETALRRFRPARGIAATGSIIPHTAEARPIEIELLPIDLVVPRVATHWPIVRVAPVSNSAAKATASEVIGPGVGSVQVIGQAAVLVIGPVADPTASATATSPAVVVATVMRSAEDPGAMTVRERAQVAVVVPPAWDHVVVEASAVAEEAAAVVAGGGSRKFP